MLKYKGSLLATMVPLRSNNILNGRFPLHNRSFLVDIGSLGYGGEMVILGTHFFFCGDTPLGSFIFK